MTESDQHSLFLAMDTNHSQRTSSEPGLDAPPRGKQSLYQRVQYIFHALSNMGQNGLKSIWMTSF